MLRPDAGDGDITEDASRSCSSVAGNLCGASVLPLTGGRLARPSGRRDAGVTKT